MQLNGLTTWSLTRFKSRQVLMNALLLLMTFHIQQITACSSEAKHIRPSVVQTAEAELQNTDSQKRLTEGFWNAGGN